MLPPLGLWVRKATGDSPYTRRCPSSPRVSGSSFVVLEDALALLLANPGPLLGALSGLLFRDDKSNRRQIKTEMSYKVSSGSPSLSSIDGQRNSSKAPANLVRLNEAIYPREP